MPSMFDRPLPMVKRGQQSLPTKDFNRHRDATNKIARSLVDFGLIDSTGIHSRKRNVFKKFDSKTFEVQSAATGQGVYNCYEQKLLNAEWADVSGDDKFDDSNSTSIEVFNLFESEPVNVLYERALAKEDRIRAWKWIDDSNATRWVGVPIIGGQPRRAQATQGAGSGSSITCNLFKTDGQTLITTGLGSGITVNCEISGGSALNAAVPRLGINDKLIVYNQGGLWYCTTIFYISCISDAACT